MIAVKNYQQKWNQIPSTVKSFLIKALLLLIIWKFLYLVFLNPSRILDKPLTYFTAISTTGTLNFFSHENNYTAKPEIDEYNADGVFEKQNVMAIYFQNQRILSIADACNGLELFILYAGFIICFPATVKRKVLYTSGGLLFIVLINILRCVALTLIFINYPQYGDFSHHYLFTFIIYACIFLLWWQFSKTPQDNAQA